MQCTVANPPSAKGQGKTLTVRIKTRLIERGETVTSVARKIGCARNTASLAINRGLFRQTLEKICQHLNLQ